VRALVTAILAAAAACSNGSAPAPAPATAQPARVPAAPIVAPAIQGPHGTVATKRFSSAALGVDKSYVVYLPAGYDEQPSRRWPVFYYLHGLGGSEVNWVEGGQIDKTADRLGLAAILVMPDGDDGFYVDGVAPIDYDACMKDGTGMFMPGHEPKRTSCVRKRGYETYITKDLIAHVDATYRTIATKEGRAIAGLSMGGFGALQLAMRHPDLFAAAASHSGVVSLIYNGPHPYQKGKVEILKDPKQWGGPFVEIKRWMVGLFGDDIAHWRQYDPTTLVDTLKPGMLALYIDCGTEDLFFLQNHAAWLHDLLIDRKIEHEFFLGPGGHDFGFWKPRVENSLTFLRDHTIKPT
jgi:S-formylglutathione hydrolase FrmB